MDNLESSKIYSDRSLFRSLSVYLYVCLSLSSLSMSDYLSSVCLSLSGRLVSMICPIKFFRTSTTLDNSSDNRRSTYRQLNQTFCEIGFQLDSIAALKTNDARDDGKAKKQGPTFSETMPSKNRHFCVRGTPSAAL